jgi:hypothetical protein
MNKVKKRKKKQNPQNQRNLQGMDPQDTQNPISCWREVTRKLARILVAPFVKLVHEHHICYCFVIRSFRNNLEIKKPNKFVFLFVLCSLQTMRIRFPLPETQCHK